MTIPHEALRNAPFISCCFAALLVLYEPVHKGILDPGGFRPNESPIGLGRFAITENGIHALKRFGCSCKYYHTAHRPIKAVHDTEEYCASFFVAVTDILFGHFNQGLISCDISLDQNSARLVDGKQVVVLK